VAMVNQTAIPHSNSSVIDTDTCPLPAPHHNGSDPNPQKEGEFVWDEATQGLVLGSFFYGYVLTQVPGGRMAELYGGKKIYGYGVLITAVFTLITPLAAHWDLPLLVLVRILEGMGEGVTYPAMHAMLAHWIPPLERNKFAAIVYAGSNIGTVISMPLAGWLCSLDFLGGWPSAFYIFGLLGILWFIAWMYLVYDKPSDHPRISESEREYIERSLQVQRLINQDLAEAEEEEGQDEVSLRAPPEEPIPWSSLLTSVPLWAILLTQCGQGWAFYTQLTELPTYMKQVLRFSLKSNGLLSSLPYLAMWLFSMFISVVADWMISSKRFSHTATRKLINSIGQYGPGVALIAASYTGCDRALTLAILTIGVGLNGGIYSGFKINHLDLTPRFAGFLMSITNCSANLAGLLAPIAAGHLISDPSKVSSEVHLSWKTDTIKIYFHFSP